MSTNEGLPKLCVILGTGASYDIHSNAAPELDPAFRPPLASQLCKISDRAYSQVEEYYLRARYVFNRVEAFERGGNTPDGEKFDLEKALRFIAHHNDPVERNNYKEVPPYLRGLLMKASYEHATDPTNYITPSGTLGTQVAVMPLAEAKASNLRRLLCVF